MIGTLTSCVALCVLAVVYLHLLLVQLRLPHQNSAATPAGTDWPPVSVLVPAYNEELVIESTIKALISADYPRLQLIVIDDGSVDRTAQLVAALASSDPRILLLRQRVNVGKANALNAGIAATHSEYLVVVDADTVPHPQFLKRIVAPLLYEDADAVAGSVRVGNQHRYRLTSLFQEIEYVSVLNATRLIQGRCGIITTIAGAAGAMRRRAVLAVGGYSPATLAEDADLTLRFAREGYRVLYQPSAIAYTEVPSTWRSLFDQRVRWLFGNFQCIRDYWDCARTTSSWRFYGFPVFVYENTVKPPLEFYRSTVPILVLSGLVHPIALYAYVGLLLLNWLSVAVAFRRQKATANELLLVPLQFALWHFFLILPYCAAVWHLAVGHQVSWRKSPRAGKLA
jgi:cellulose synthase/poly-beta-1,6-N-acetylglucosamine synthase-like glycosyltransferase